VFDYSWFLSPLPPTTRMKAKAMKLHSRRKLRVEGLEARILLAADVAAISEANVENNLPCVVGNGMLYQSDQVEVSQTGSYVAAHTNESANTVRLTPDSDFGLAEAITAAGPRGTVIVEAGTYTESSVMITEPVTILGEEGAVIEFDSEAAITTPRLIDAGFHIKNTRQVTIRGLEIRDNDTGSTAILIEGSEHVSIEDNQITDFQFGVLVESANHSTIGGNDIGMSSGMLPVTSFGIIVVNGFGNQVRDNTVSKATFGIFVSGENGKLLNNTTNDNFVGVMLCNLPDNIQLPDGQISGSEVSATNWLVQGNTSTNNLTVGYLVIDGSNNNTLTNNLGGGNGTYDIELTAFGDRFGLSNLPASYDNLVNAGSHKGLSIEDAGVNNKVHGGG
jgi:parallel beta-helix repeat protein